MNQLDKKVTMLFSNCFTIKCGLIIAFFALNPCLAYEFAVEGEMQIREYYKGELELSTNYFFSADVKNCNARIRAFGGWHNQVAYYEYGYNGECSYLCVRFSTNGVGVVLQSGSDGSERVIRDKQSKPANDATLTIYATDVPEGGRGIEPIWIAYASQCFFENRVTGSKIEPVWTKGKRNLRAIPKVGTFWKMDKHSPNLLETMAEFTNDGLSNYETTNSMYSVLAWTNIGGVNLPLSFQATQFRVYESSDRHCVYTGLAHTFRRACSVTNFFPPDLAMVATRVYDERLSKDNHPVATVTYLSKSGRIVESLEQLKKTQAYAKAVTLEDVAERSQKKVAVSYWRLIVVSIFACASAVLIWSVANHRKNA